MVEILEFSFERMAKILPAANTQPCPILVGDRMPPGQSLARQQSDSHFDNLCRLRHPATSQNCWTLNVQLASFWASPSNFSGFSNFIFDPVNVPGPVAAGAGAGAGGVGGGTCCAAVYAACHHFTTSSIKSFAVCGALKDT